MKNKSLLLLLVMFVANGMLKAQCKIDSILNSNYIKGTGAKDPATYYKYLYDSKDSNVGINYYTWNVGKNKWIHDAKEQYILDANGFRKQILAEALIYNKWAKQYKTDITPDANGRDGTYLTSYWDSASNDYVVTTRYILVYNANKKVTQGVQQNWNSSTTSWDNRSRYNLYYNGSGFITGQITSEWNADSGKWLNYFKVDYKLNQAGAPYSYSFFRWECDVLGCRWEFSDSTYYYRDAANRDTANYRFANNEIIQRTLTSYTLSGCVDRYLYYYQDNVTKELYAGSETQYTYRSKNSAMDIAGAVKLNIFPNPANTELTIENARGTITVIDPVTGRTLINTEAGNTKTVINTTELVNGVYILHVNNQHIKFIIQH